MFFISRFFFLLCLFIGTLIVFSSSSWFGLWIGLELNLLSFIPVIVNNNNNFNATESAIKYFLVQTLASLIFLFFSITYILKFSLFFYFNLNYENFIINILLLIKLGAAPFHFWFVNIVENFSWINLLILITWQKLAPLNIIFYFHNNNLLIIFIVISSITGAILGLNQTSLRKILTFSSINHISWILLANLYRNFLWIFYFFIYSLINFSIILIFKIYNIFFINQIFMFRNKNLYLNFFLFLNIFSLGGLPPFLGFLPKWLVIEYIILSDMYMLIFFIILINLITLYFYCRLIYSTFTLNNLNFKWRFFFLNLKSFKIFFLITFNVVRVIFIIFFLIINFC